MDKKIITILLIVFIFGISMGSGIIWILDSGDTKIYEEDEFIDPEEVSNNVSEEKLSPDAVIILNHKYLLCGHTSYENLENKFVNKTKEDLEELYADYEIIEFVPSKVVFLNEIDTLCKEHYTIKLENGVVTVFEENQYGRFDLYEKTGIYEEYLTQMDKEELANGISVIGKENLNLILENYH